MALPAGRYGVTKNQLLKIKKLPMNTIKLIEELTEKFDLLGTAAFKNSTSVVTQSTDLVESGAVYDALGFGNKNKLPYFTETKTSSGTLTVTPSNGRYSFTGTASGASAIQYPVTVPINSGVYRFIADGYGYIANSNISLYYDDNGTAKALAPDDTIDLSTYTITTIAFFAGANVTVNYQNIGLMLVKESESDKSFEPYHASVEESLEEKCDNSVIGTVEGANASKTWSVGEHFISGGQFKEVTQPIASGGAINDSNTVDKPIADMLKPIDVTNECTFAQDIAYITKVIKKVNNVVHIYLRFTTPSTQIANKQIMSVASLPFMANNETFFCLGALLKKWSGESSGTVNITAIGEVVMNEYAVSTEVVCNLSYICL